MQVRMTATDSAGDTGSHVVSISGLVPG
jgi:hypothetical protein